jgi:hypothetical protein
MSDPLRMGSGVSLPHGPVSLVARSWFAVLRRLASISEDLTKVSQRGFTVPRAEIVERLESIGSHFVGGYSLALGCTTLGELALALERVQGEDAGFVYEGAAMGVAIADQLTPGRRWFDAFVQGPAKAHEYMAWVGLGWALARLPVSPLRALGRYRNLNKWLALDGWGFHQGYFDWPRSVQHQGRPRSLVGDAARVFDQGLGRSLWFVRGAEVDAVAAAVNAFDAARHADLWSGVGLAATYAGGVPPGALLQLRELAGPSASALAQGVVFAAQARRRAGNPAAHSELACTHLLGLTATAAADIALSTLPQGDDGLEAYQCWRLAIQRNFPAAQTAKHNIG